MSLTLDIHLDCSIPKLIDIIGAGPNPTSSNNIPIRASMVNGKKVRGRYYALADRSGENADIYEPNNDVITNNSLIKRHVDALLEEGKSFVTEVGSYDNTCRIIWEIDV